MEVENDIKKKGLPKNYNKFNYIKSIGFSDKKLSKLTNNSEDKLGKKDQLLKFFRSLRKLTLVQLNLNLLHLICIQPIKEILELILNVKLTPLVEKKIIILGGGPNRIGQGIEFDYCCCQASFALKEAGLRNNYD